MQKVFINDMTVLEEFSLDPAANWFDPADTLASKARTSAIELLKKVDLSKKKRDQVKAATSELQRTVATAPGPSYKWIGWLNRDVDGNFVMRYPKGKILSDNGRLAICFIPYGSTVARVQSIGQIKNGEVLIDSATKPASKDAFVGGRAIFLLAPIDQ